jgi:hypothetical protein
MISELRCSAERRSLRPDMSTPKIVAALTAWLAGCVCVQAATYQVGPSRTYHTVGSLPSLSAGDSVEIDPATYNEVKRWTTSGTASQPINIRGMGASRPVFDATGLNVDGALPHPRAVFQVEADYIALENLEFRNARNGDNGAGVRVTSGNNITVRNCRIAMCDMGIMCDNNSNLVIEASEVCSNGTSLYDGYSHNFYLGGKSATVRFCYIHDSLYGQNFKTRAHYTELLYNYIADSQDGEVGLVDAAETAAANSHAVMIGNIVLSKPRLSGYNTGRFIQFGQDSGGQHNGTLFAFNNTFIAGDGRIQFLSANVAGATVVANNNVFYSSEKILGTLGGGISGSNNWMQSTATVPATFYASVQAGDPGFVNRAARDLHLTAASGCRNRGLNALLYLDGTGALHSGLPTLEYVNHLQNRPRPTDGQTDLGAYEYRVPAFSAIRFSGNDCLLDFTAATGNQYDLQSTSNLVGNFWSPVRTNIPGTDGTIRITDTNAVSQPRRFYRLQSSL